MSLSVEKHMTGRAHTPRWPELQKGRNGPTSSQHRVGSETGSQDGTSVNCQKKQQGLCPQHSLPGTSEETQMNSDAAGVSSSTNTL